MAQQARGMNRYSDSELVDRLRSILLNAAEGQRSVGDDRAYTQIRKTLDRRSVGLPRAVSLHPTMDSFGTFLKELPDRDARKNYVREDLRDLQRLIDDSAKAQPAETSTWTGIQSPVEQVNAVRALLPVAQASVELLIQELSRPGPNGGPLLDEREEAVESLRELHRTLGGLLQAADSGHLSDGLGQGLAAEAVRYAKRALQMLRDDPMPYATATMVVAVLGASGLGTAAGLLGGMALSIRKKAE